jgi:hypothetical protein
VFTSISFWSMSTSPKLLSLAKVPMIINILAFKMAGQLEEHSPVTRNSSMEMWIGWLTELLAMSTNTIPNMHRLCIRPSLGVTREVVVGSSGTGRGRRTITKAQTNPYTVDAP